MASEEQASSQEFTTTSNVFAAVVYKKLLKNHKNNFLASPFSAEIVLALAQSGCKGETAQEIRNALCLPDDKDRVESEIKDFLSGLKEDDNFKCNCINKPCKSFLPGLGRDENYKLRCANKMYVTKKFSLKHGFKKAAAEIYRADIETIDFKQNQKAAAKMNRWVEKKTKNKIQNLVGPSDVNEATGVVIMNALYFKSDWVIQFQLADTIQADFYINANHAVKVDTMHYDTQVYKEFFNFHWNGELKAGFLELPFKGKNAAMVVALPGERDGLARLESQLDKVFAAHEFKSTFMVIALPKFEITSQIDFKEILENLGVRKAFEKNEADLSGIAGDKGDLLIDKVVQKTFIKVNENGVEAAAATYAPVLLLLSGIVGEPTRFIADHPFIFYIKINDVVVFAGRVTNPLL